MITATTVNHLADRGAATLVRRGNQGSLRRTRHVPHLVSIGENFLLVGNIARSPGVETRGTGNFRRPVMLLLTCPLNEPPNLLTRQDVYSGTGRAGRQL